MSLKTNRSCSPNSSEEKGRRGGKRGRRNEKQDKQQSGGSLSNDTVTTMVEYLQTPPNYDGGWRAAPIDAERRRQGGRYRRLVIQQERCEDRKA